MIIVKKEIDKNMKLGENSKSKAKKTKFKVLMVIKWVSDVTLSPAQVKRFTESGHEEQIRYLQGKVSDTLRNSQTI